MNDATWQHFINSFNQRDYIEAVLALETFWLVDRQDFHKALIRVCVALNQLRLGLITSPRFLLRSAHELLATYEPAYQQLDVAALRAFVLECLELIPAELQTGQGTIDLSGLPAYQFQPIDQP
jgi:predicted metal-dependent hydrolase